MAGLDSFVTGLAKGYTVGGAITDGIRGAQDRKARKEITKEAQEKFGGLTDEAYSYMADRYAAVLADHGDIEGARDWLTFSKDSKARAGADIFAKGLVDLNRGNYDGFFENAGKLGKLSGYGDDYELVGTPERHFGKDGALQGFRVTYKDGAGKEFKQDIPVDRLAEFYSATASPQAAFDAIRAQKLDEQKRKADVEDFAAKEKIKADAGRPKERREGRGKSYDAALDALKNNLDFQDASPEEQQRMIRDLANQRQGFVGARGGDRGGGPVPGLTDQPPPGGGIVNRRTGEAITNPELERQRNGAPPAQAPEQAPLTAPEAGVAGAHDAAASPTANFDAMRSALEERAARIREQRMAAQGSTPVPRSRPEIPGLGIASAGGSGIRRPDQEERIYR